MQKQTKYIKVNVADRLPEKTGIYITNLGSLLFYEYEDEEVFKSLRSEKIFSISQIEFWLDEIPDREEEMREMLERIYNIENNEFGKSSFNVEDLKRKIKRVLES